MARATKRTSVVLGGLAVLFVVIIVILCIVPKGGSPPPHSEQGWQKSKEVEDVYTDSSTASTTTTTSTTTRATTIATTTSTTTTPEIIAVQTTSTTTEEPSTAASTAATTTTTSTTSTPSSTPDATTEDLLFPATTTESSTSITPTNDTLHDAESTVSSTTDDSHSHDTTTDDFFESTNASTTDDSLSYDTTTQSTPLSTTDDSLYNDTTTQSSPLSTTDDSLYNDTTTQSSPLSTTDDSLYNDTTTQSTPLSTTDDSLYNDTTSESTTHEPTTTPPPTTTEQSTTVITTDVTMMESTATPAATTLSSEESNTCNTPACKTVAANMLAMMDHRTEVGPCKDFYQYACGGLMQKDFLSERDLHRIATKRIEDRLRMVEASDTLQGKMKTFYDSCLNAVNQDATDNWKQTLSKVFGKHHFVQSPVASATPLNLTDILAEMMQYDFAPFFDMGLGVDKEDSESFSITLHPVVPGSLFSEDLARRVCLEEHHRKLESLGSGNSYNVEEEYNTFTACVLHGKGLEARLERMEEAVQRFGLLDHLGDSTVANQVLQTTKATARNFLQDLSAKLPSVPKLKQDLVNKNYLEKSVIDLSSTFQVIDWETFLSQLIDVPDISHVKVQLYLDDYITDILEELQRYNNMDPMALSNVLLMLWSEKLYTDFVKPLGSSVGEHEYCLHAAITLMQDTAASLYMDSLSDDEKTARTTQVTNIASLIKRAGIKELERNGQNSKDAMDKLEYMLDNVQTPDSSTLRKHREEKVNHTTSDFFDDCIELLRKRRKLTYQAYQGSPTEEWLRFMQPQNPFGVHIYEMSKIMVPFAAQEDSETFENIPAYLSFARIGHMISHLVMHGYDTSGVQYQPSGPEELNVVQYYINKKNGLDDQYRAEQSYKGTDGVTANVMMSALALNELLADSGATLLAWEAYLLRNDPDPTDAPIPTEKHNTQTARRRRSPRDLTQRFKRETAASLDSEKPLPWLDLSPIQLYFLHWSQQHCSADGGLNLLDLMESKQVPGRMRVNLVLQNEALFNEAFQCIPKTKESPFTLG